MENVKIGMINEDNTIIEKDSGISQKLVNNIKELLFNLDEPYSIGSFYFDTNLDIIFGIMDKNEKGQQRLIYKLKICKHKLL